MDPRNHPGVIRFVAAAKAYCRLIEERPEKRNPWMRELTRALAELYAAAWSLPCFGLPDHDSKPPESWDINHDEWRQLFADLGKFLGDRNHYLSFFDPVDILQTPKDLSIGMLADDLADIYRDIRPGLRVWDSTHDEWLQEAIYDWRWPNFDQHWGVHATSALQALHWWVGKEDRLGIPTPEDDAGFQHKG